MSATLVMPAPGKSSPVPSGPRVRFWTTDEFDQLCDLGLFDGQRAFLVNGVILEQGPMNPRHAMATQLTEDALRGAFGAGWSVRGQKPVNVGAATNPMPDIAVVPGGPRDYAKHPAAARLVVEVADSSLDYDLTTKAEVYAAAGVADYWVLDVEGRKLHVLRDPAPIAAGGHSYRTRLSFGPGDMVAPLAAPAAQVAVADLLP